MHQIRNFVSDFFLEFDSQEASLLKSYRIRILGLVYDFLFKFKANFEQET